MAGFHRRGPEIDLDLPEEEIGLLRFALRLLEGVALDDPADPAAQRLCYRAHPGDPEAEARFRDLTTGSLEADRTADRHRFGESLQRGTLSREDAAAWLRVLAEARLALGARLGIEEDGWEQAGEADSVARAVLQLYGSVQDDLTAVLLGPR